MKILTYFHNRRTKKYAYYYSIVLVIVSSTIIMDNLQMMRLTAIELGLVFGEGFFSLFMLARHENTEKQFERYISNHLFKKESVTRLS